MNQVGVGIEVEIEIEVEVQVERRMEERLQGATARSDCNDEQMYVAVAVAINEMHSNLQTGRRTRWRKGIGSRGIGDYLVESGLRLCFKKMAN